MKAPYPSSDPLLTSLAEEAAALPMQAAMEARKRNAQRKQNRRGIAMFASASLIGIITVTIWPAATERPAEPGAVTTTAAIKPEIHETMPTGLNTEQMAFVKATGDMPLLLVRDSSGQVTRIHVIER